MTLQSNINILRAPPFFTVRYLSVLSGAALRLFDDPAEGVPGGSTAEAVHKLGHYSHPFSSEFLVNAPITSADPFFFNTSFVI